MKHICQEAGFSLSSFDPCNSKEITKIITSMKNKTSVGWDEIPIKLIKEVVTLISVPLALITNQSLKEGVFPEKLKYSQISPIQERV